MLDRDLAALYGVPVKSLNQAVKRNVERFPEDFMFRLTEDEWNNLRSQIVTANISKVRFTPFVFTQFGILMLANVLKSPKAIEMSIQIIRVFEQLRQIAIENIEISQRLSNLEQHFINYAKGNNQEIKKIYEAINLLMDRTKPTSIGFVKDEK